MSRKYIIAGNWKMNKTTEEGEEIASEISSILKNEIKDINDEAKVSEVGTV